MLSIPLSAEAEARLRERAAAAGEDLATYAARLLETVSRPRTLEELSGPVARRFAQSGVTEEELGEELERAKHEMRAERRARNSS